MNGLFKGGAARIATAGALGLAALATTTTAAQAQGWHNGWRNHSGSTVVVRCDWRGDHCRRVVVYNHNRYGYGYGYHRGYHAYRYGDGYRHNDRHHRW